MTNSKRDTLSHGEPGAIPVFWTEVCLECVLKAHSSVGSRVFHLCVESFPLRKGSRLTSGNLKFPRELYRMRIWLIVSFPNIAAHHDSGCHWLLQWLAGLVCAGSQGDRARMPQCLRMRTRAQALPLTPPPALVVITSLIQVFYIIMQP